MITLLKFVLIIYYLLYCCNSDQTIDTEDFWYRLIPKLASDLSSLCPISSEINATEDGFLGYPYEIMGTKQWSLRYNYDDDVYSIDDETINKTSNNLLYLCRGIDDTMNLAGEASQYSSKLESINHCLGSHGKDNCPILVEHLQQGTF